MATQTENEIVTQSKASISRAIEARGYKPFLDVPRTSPAACLLFEGLAQAAILHYSLEYSRTGQLPRGHPELSVAMDGNLVFNGAMGVTIDNDNLMKDLSSNRLLGNVMGIEGRYDEFDLQKFMSLLGIGPGSGYNGTVVTRGGSDLGTLVHEWFHVRDAATVGRDLPPFEAMTDIRTIALGLFPQYFKPNYVNARYTAGLVASITNKGIDPRQNMAGALKNLERSFDYQEPLGRWAMNNLHLLELAQSTTRHHDDPRIGMRELISKAIQIETLNPPIDAEIILPPQ